MEDGSISRRKKAAVALLAVGAAFALIYHLGYTVKPFDAVIAALGVFLLLDEALRGMLKEARPPIDSYGKYFAALMAFLVLGQIAGYFFYGSNLTFDLALLKDYGRVVFNGAVFLFVAFLVSRYGNLLPYMSWAIFLSPLVVLPAYSMSGESFYTSGGRLTGFLQNPLIFGLWMVIVFLIGLAFFLRYRQWWLRAAVGIWLIVISNFILWSASRAAWLSLALGLSLWCLFYLNKKERRTKIPSIVLVTLVAFSVGYLFLPDNGLKIKSFVAERVIKLVSEPLEHQTRTHTWRAAWPVLREDILGLGLGNVVRPTFVVRVGEQSFTMQATANTFLETVRYGGLGALAVLVAILAKLALDIVRSLKKASNPEVNDLELAWLVAAPAAVFDAFFTDGFLFRHLWFVLGMGLGVAWLILRKHEALPGPRS